MSNLIRDHDALVAAVMHAVAAFQDATDEVDEAAARRLGVNRTDLRCLGILSRAGALPSGRLAAQAKLTPGATTTAVDRLALAGYVHRVRDEGDRRRVTVEVTEEARRRFEEIWGPLGRESQQRLASRSRRDLQVIHTFLEEGLRLQREHADRIAAAVDPPPRHGRAGG